MTNKNQIAESELVAKQEAELLEALNQLPTDATPETNLWFGIRTHLKVERVKPKARSWVPWAMAATLLISFGIFVASWQNLQQAQRLVAQEQNERSVTSSVIADEIKMMEQDYGLAKSALLAQIAVKSADIDTDLLSDVKTNLIIIEQATSELKGAIELQPENPALPQLLKATYQQELVVLSQLAKLSQDI